ncbi:MAG: thioredoxin [Bacteroidales bacterium]|jgi:thioredoxin 1|nr:thioredoxin [Bacteroidales bacterium]
MAVVITESNFEELVLKSDKPVLVDFWAAWCGPCRAVSPLVDQLATEYEGKALIGKVDVDTDGELAQQFGILSIPSLLYFKEGKLVDKQVGSTTKEVLAGKLDALL